MSSSQLQHQAPKGHGRGKGRGDNAFSPNRPRVLPLVGKEENCSSTFSQPSSRTLGRGQVSFILFCIYLYQWDIRFLEVLIPERIIQEDIKLFSGVCPFICSVSSFIGHRVLFNKKSHLWPL